MFSYIFGKVLNVYPWFPHIFKSKYHAHTNAQFTCTPFYQIYSDCDPFRLEMCLAIRYCIQSCSLFLFLCLWTCNILRVNHVWAVCSIYMCGRWHACLSEEFLFAHIFFILCFCNAHLIPYSNARNFYMLIT